MIQFFCHIFRAVYGYEGQTNNLKIRGTGNGGLEEMIEELNSGEIMYAFCRVIDTKTSLKKCLLINWQGEGAPIVRKGTCANHIRDIEKLLKGAHITINARSEEDVEVDLIMEKLARATGSAYKFKEPRGQDVGNSLPVGTVYKRVNPEAEINATERDEFWQREEIEEKARIQQEKIRRDAEQKKIELETKTREEKLSKLREKAENSSCLTSQNNHHDISQQRIQELKNLKNKQIANQSTTNGDEDNDGKSKSEELKRQRNNETQQLIAQRTINARAVFEQNSSAGQMKSFVTKNSVISKMSSNIKSTITKVPDTPKDIVPAKEVNEKLVEEELPKKEIIPIPKSTVETIPQVEPTPPEIQQEQQIVNTQENELYNQLTGENYLYFDPNNEGMKARALYDYQAADETEITFDPGDIITHIDAIDEGWWQGLGPNGAYGLFPANYVEVIDSNTS